MATVVQGIARYRWVILALALVSQLTAGSASKVLAPLAPIFQPELGLTKAEVGLFSSAAFAGAWAILLVGGSLTDRFGIRKVMSLGQLVTGALLLSMAAVGSLIQATAVMFAVGLGRGTVFPGTTKAIMEWFAPGARATAMGVKQAGAPIAGIATAAILPAVGLAMGWRSAVALVGFAVIAGGVVTGILYRDPPYSARVVEEKPGMRAAMRDALRNRTLWVLGSIAILFVMAQQALALYLALYFTEVVLVPQVPDEATRIVAAGGYLALLQTGGVCGRVFWGVVSDRVFGGRRAVVMAIVGVLAALLSLVFARLAVGLPLWLLAVVVFACGTTALGWNGVYHALVAETVGRKYAATGVGLSMTMIESGTTVGPPLFGFVVDATSYETGWLFLGLFYAAGSLVAILSARGEKRAA